MKQSQTDRILELLVSYRVLTVEQFSRKLGSSEQMIRRWLRKLQEQNQIKKIPRTSNGRGRPAPAFCRIKDDFKPLLIEHQLALNAFRLSLELSFGKDVSFLAHTNANLRLRIPTTPSKRQFHTFIPDGVFSLSKESKSLLFFVEIDMGTEPLKSKRDGATDFLEKLDSYRVYFSTKGYKAFEKRFNRKYTGFRLLVVSNTEPRLRSLSELVKSEPYCQFIWLCDLDSVTTKSWQSCIWSAGGISTTLKSIVIPPKKDEIL